MLIKLFKVLKRYYPEFTDRSFIKENIYKHIYKNVKYNDSTFRNLMSDLLKLALQFLKQEGFEKKDSESSFFLTEELFKRGEHNLFNSQMKLTEKNLESRNITDDEYFYSKYKIEKGKFFLNLLVEKTIKKSTVTSESEKYINGIVHFICFFVKESLTLNTILLNYSNSYNINKNIGVISNFLELFDFEKITDFITENSNLKVPIIEIYFNSLKTFVDLENEKNYFDFKNSLISHSKQLGLNENYFLYSSLIDYCVTKKTKGLDSSFDLDREIFELHSILWRKEYFKSTENSYIPIDLYRNVLINCIAVKELKVMEEFIHKYSRKVVPNQISNVENYSYALLNFEKGAYHKALNSLNRVKFDQSVYKVDIKILQLKINYELEYYESAISIIDTYKHFLNNNQLISESRKSLLNNFLAFTLKLIQYNTGSRKINLSYLESRIGKSKNIYDREWLLEKIRKKIEKETL